MDEDNEKVIEGTEPASPESERITPEYFESDVVIPQSDEQTTVSEAAPTQEPVDGEYHFVRPEQRLYEDAQFDPEGEDTTPPEYFVPSEKKPHAKKSSRRRKRFLRVAALCLVCALLGGLAGAGMMALLQKDDTPIPIPQETTKPISGDSGKNVSNKTGSTANDIYAAGCQQVVGITTSVNFTNFFGMTSSSAVSGSGFVVTADGYILTNYHVIEYAFTGNSSSPVTVMFKDGSSYEASIVGVEEDNDLAVLKIDASNLVPATMGDSDSIQVGDIVYAIGNPLGELDFSMSTGSVSALDRSIVTEENKPGINMFQIDAAVNSGNSGGPVYNTKGEVIGIVTAKSGVSGTEGLGFAIPINDAVSIANDLITKGYVTGKAYMGVNIDTRYTSVYAEYYDMPEGAYVFNVESGSCAEKAGISNGDIITALGDQEIRSYTDLNAAVHSFKAGETTQVTVYRNNDFLQLTITFDETKPNGGSNTVNGS